VLPRAGKDLESSLRELAHAVLLRDKQKWCGQPDLHRHRLNGVQASCSWTMAAKKLENRKEGGAGLDLSPAPPTTKKNKHRCQLGEELAPAGYFTADLSVFVAHLSCAPPDVNQAGREASGSKIQRAGIRHRLPRSSYRVRQLN